LVQEPPRHSQLVVCLEQSGGQDLVQEPPRHSQLVVCLEQSGGQDLVQEPPRHSQLVVCLEQSYETFVRNRHLSKIGFCHLALVHLLGLGVVRMLVGVPLRENRVEGLGLHSAG